MKFFPVKRGVKEQERGAMCQIWKVEDHKKGRWLERWLEKKKMC